MFILSRPFRLNLNDNIKFYKLSRKTNSFPISNLPQNGIQIRSLHNVFLKKEKEKNLILQKNKKLEQFSTESSTKTSSLYFSCCFIW